MGLLNLFSTTAQPATAIDPCMGDPAAQGLRDAMERRDWPTVSAFLTQVTDPDDRGFYVSVCADVKGVQDWIGQAVVAEPHSTLPLLVQGAHAVVWAWDARGRAYAEHTGDDQFRDFFQRLRVAENCLDAVVARDPGDTTAWTSLLITARGRQVDRDEAMRRFGAVVAQHPRHLRAHSQMLQYLCEKWFGSHDEMFAFARAAVAEAPPGGPLPRLIAEAHIERWLALPRGEARSYFTQPAVRAELNAAADRSIRHPAYQYRPGWPLTHNTFAFAFALAQDRGAARQQFEIIGDRVTEQPWGYLRADAAKAFAKMRRAAYA
jgi:hypothetical protein